jgi:multidrug efflux pump subunit AcrB
MSMVISNFLALTITPFFYYFLKRNVKVVTKENDETDKFTKLYEKYIHSII